MSGQNNTEHSCTRRTFTRTIGLGLFSTGIATEARGGEASETERLIIGTDSQYGVDFAIQKSASVEKTVDVGSIGNAVVGQFDPKTVEDLEQATGVRYVERDNVVSVPDSISTGATTTESIDFEPRSQLTPWGCEQVGAMAAHEQGITGNDVDVAIIDTGIDSDHPDLNVNLGKGYAAELCGGSSCHTNWDDDHSHGTHCAGIAGACDNSLGVIGLAPNVTLHAVKVMTGMGTGSASGIAEGISWAVDQGYDVANVSLGSTSESKIIHDAVKYADNNGMLVVAAAGNAGPCSDCLHYPGAYEETVCVGAVTPEKDLAEFSSTGSAVDIVAPGEAVPSTIIGGEYREFSGTSMATPHVVGAAALLMSQGYSHTEARQRLLDTADDIGLDESESGAGLLNCQAALGGGDGSGSTAAVQTESPASVGEMSATLQGKLTEMNGADSLTVGFEYWPAAADQNMATRVDAGTQSSTGAFETSVSSLQNDTEYVYRAVCVGDGFKTTGSTRSFTTSTDAPSVSVRTSDVTDVNATGATFHGELTDLDGADAVKVAFEYWVDGQRNESVTVTDQAKLTDTGTFSVSETGLDSSSNYVVRAMAVPADATVSYGSEKSFSTPSGTGLTIEATGADDVQLFGATLNGDVTSLDNGSDRVRVGFRYWEDGQKSDSVSTVEAGSVSNPGTFDVNVIDLNSDTTYQYVAYARPEEGKEVSSDAQTFTTAGQSW